MTLDPQIQAFMGQLAAQQSPKIWDIPVEQTRALYRLMTSMTDEQNLPVGKVEDRGLPGPAGTVPIRLYTPVAAGSDLLPCLVYYHGGGMIMGDLDTHDALCRRLAAEADARIIAVDYRLAPEAPFPAAVDDAWAALNWVADNAMDLDIDANRIAVGGDSAGGNLAAVVAQMAARQGGPSLVYQLLLYPWLDYDGGPSRAAFGEGYGVDQPMMDFFARLYFPAGADPDDPRLSPLRQKDVSGVAPALVVTAGYDPLKDEGIAYADKLKKAGVAATHENYAGMVHGFFAMTAVSTAARDAVKKTGQRLKAVFGA